MTVTGKVVGQHRYIHTQLLSHLSNDDRDRVESAIHIAQVSPSKQFNVVKLAANTAQVTLLDYPDFFEEAFPVLRRFWTVDLEQGTCRHRTYEDSTNPPILHRKELLLPSNHPSQRDYTELTLAAEQIGLFDDTARIGFQRPWVALLTQKGYRVADHQLVPIGNNEASEEVPGQEVFTNRLIEELPNQIYTAPVLEGNLGAFSANCILPELADYPGKLNGLVSAPDVWLHMAAAGWINPGRVTPYVDSTGASSILDCEQAMSALAVDTLAAADRQLKYLSDRLHPGGGVLQTTIAGQLSDFETAMLGINRTADQTIRHYAMINIVKHSAENAAGIAAATFTAKQLDTSYFTMKTVAEGALPKLRNLVEALVYAVFPIVFLLVIAAGAMGGKVLSMYAMAGVWIHLWAPLYAVINSFMHRSSKEGMLQITETAGGTIENLPHLLQMTVSDQGMAGLMVISVPAIALAIVKGGAVAMSGVVNSLMSPAQSAAARMGSEMGMGNVSGAKVNWGGANFDSSVSLKNGFSSGNQLQNTFESPGGMGSEKHGDTEVVRGSDGAIQSIKSPAGATLGGSGFSERAQVAESGKRVESAREDAVKKGQELVAAFENTGSTEYGRKGETGVRRSTGTDNTAKEGTAVGDTVGTGNQKQQTTTTDAGNAKSDAWIIQGGGSVNVPTGLSSFLKNLGKKGDSSAGSSGGAPGASLGARLDAQGRDEDRFSQALRDAGSANADKRAEARKTLDEAAGYFDKLSAESTDANTKNAMQKFAGSLRDVSSASRNLTESIKAAETASTGTREQSGVRMEGKVESQTAAIRALAQAMYGNDSNASIFGAAAFAANNPMAANDMLNKSVAGAENYLNAAGAAPRSPESINEAAPGNLDRMDMQNRDGVRQDDLDNRNTVQSLAPYTPESQSNNARVMAEALNGLATTRSNVGGQGESVYAQNGARIAAMEMARNEMNSREQDFNAGDLQSRAAQYETQILNASQNDPELRSMLVDQGSSPANSGGYSPEDFHMIKARSGVSERPAQQDRNLGNVSDTPGA